MRVRDAQELGRLVRARRMELGLSQSELAARVGSTRQWLSRFEQATNDVSLTHALAVLHALDLSIEVPSPALPLRLTPHNARQPPHPLLALTRLHLNQRHAPTGSLDSVNVTILRQCKDHPCSPLKSRSSLQARLLRTRQLFGLYENLAQENHTQNQATELAIVGRRMTYGRQHRYRAESARNPASAHSGNRVSQLIKKLNESVVRGCFALTTNG